MITKISKTEIYAQILKRKNKFLLILSIRAGVHGYITKFWWWPKSAKLKYPLKFWNVKKTKFYYQNHTKNYSAHVQGKVFPLNQTWNKFMKRFKL